MGSIFRFAAATLSWIGEEGDNSSLALKSLRQISEQQIPEGDDRLSWLRWSKIVETDPEDQGINPIMQSIESLFGRSYWRRVWILPETLLSNFVMVLCGDEMILMHEILNAVERLGGLKNRQRPSFCNRGIWAQLSSNAGSGLINLHVPRRLIDFTELVRISDLYDMHNLNDHSREMILFMFVQITSGYKATDPRDHIYSKLGLYCGRDITPNYSLSVEKVYCDYAKLWARTYNRLSFLRHSGFSTDSRASEPYIMFLPSWTPNWDAISKAGSSVSTITCDQTWCADQAPPGQLRPQGWSFEDHALRVRGLIFEEVCRCENWFQNDDDFLNFSVQYLAANKDESYPNGMQPKPALFRAVFWDKNEKPWGSSIIPLLVEVTRTAQLRPRWKEVFDFDLHSSRIADFATQTEIDEAKEKFKSADQELDPVVNAFFNRIIAFLDCSLFFTSSGYIGWGPRDMRPTDLVCILFGCETPVVLRKVGSHYIHIGPCFVLGIMYGEAVADLRDGSEKIVDFTIC